MEKENISLDEDEIKFNRLRIKRTNLLSKCAITLCRLNIKKSSLEATVLIIKQCRNLFEAKTIIGDIVAWVKNLFLEHQLNKLIELQREEHTKLTKLRHDLIQLRFEHDVEYIEKKMHIYAKKEKYVEAAFLRDKLKTMKPC